MVVDIGGGSVELIVGNRETIFHAQSLKLGAIRLNDLYLKQTLRPRACYTSSKEPSMPSSSLRCSA